MTRLVHASRVGQQVHIPPEDTVEPAKATAKTEVMREQHSCLGPSHTHA